MNLGETIKQHRKEAKMSQKELGEILGTSHDTVSLWELNKIKPDLEMFKKLCVVFDVSADELLEIETPEQKSKVLGIGWVLKA